MPYAVPYDPAHGTAYDPAHGTVYGTAHRASPSPISPIPDARNKRALSYSHNEQLP